MTTISEASSSRALALGPIIRPVEPVLPHAGALPFEPLWMRSARWIERLETMPGTFDVDAQRDENHQCDGTRLWRDVASIVCALNRRRFDGGSQYWPCRLCRRAASMMAEAVDSKDGANIDPSLLALDLIEER